MPGARAHPGAWLPSHEMALTELPRVLATRPFCPVESWKDFPRGSGEMQFQLWCDLSFICQLHHNDMLF